MFVHLFAFSFWSWKFSSLPVNFPNSFCLYRLVARNRFIPVTSEYQGESYESLCPINGTFSGVEQVCWLLFQFALGSVVFLLGISVLSLLISMALVSYIAQLLYSLRYCFLLPIPNMWRFPFLSFKRGASPWRALYSCHRWPLGQHLWLEKRDHNVCVCEYYSVKP